MATSLSKWPSTTPTRSASTSDPEIGFLGCRRYAGSPTCCERYHVQGTTEGQPQLGDAPWAGVSPDALHMRSAKGIQEHS